MNTQYYTTTTSPVLTFEEYHDIPSEHINGDRDKFSEVASRLVDIDLKLIYHAFREAIRKDRRGDEDGRVYTVAYKIYDIQARHHYMPVYERRYDVFAGCFEEVQTGCEDSIEVINVTDIDGRIWPGHMARLKNYAKRNIFITMRTIIEVAIGNITIFSAKYSRRLADKEIHKVVREGCIGIDRSKAVITIKYE